MTTRPRKQHCGRERKVRYPDKRTAIEALRRVRANGVRQQVPCRVYACDRCQGWHMTKQERPE